MPSADPPIRDSDAGARFLPKLARGRREADANRPDVAERLFREVLKDARKTPAERLACSYLAKLYVRQGRALEGLIAARRLAVLSTIDGTPEDRAFAWTGVVAAMVSLGDFARFDETVASLRASLDAYSGHHTAALRRHLHRVCATVAVARGDLATACAESDGATVPVTESAPADELRERHLLDAEIEFARGRSDDARAALALATAIPAPVGATTLAIADLETRCAFRVDGAAAALLPARRVLELLATPASVSFGATNRLDTAHRTGILLHRECRAPDDARRALDLAATASAACFAELARCSGEGSLLTPGEGSVVAEYRERLAATRRKLSSDADALLADLGSSKLAPEPGVIGLCVRCDRARLPNKSMVPFATLARTTAMTSVVHGVCASCGGDGRG